MRTKGTTKSNVGEPSKPRTGHVGFEPTYAAVKVLCLTAWRMPYIYCHIKAMASIWPNIIAMLMSLVVTVSFSFNVALVVPNAINASHTVVVIFNTNMIYTSKSNYLHFLSIPTRLCTQELKTLLRLPLSIGQKRVFHKVNRIKLSMHTGP